MDGSTTLILGGGWGGMTVAHHLRDLIPSPHRIVVIERSTDFGLGVSNLWLMTGERRSLADVRRPMHNLRRSGIDWIQAEVRALDPTARTVTTDVGDLSGDFVVIALGAELAPGSVAGFSDAAYNLYEAEEALALREKLEAFDGDKLVVLVAGAPFRCPAAPYETAMLIDDLLRRRGVRERVELSLYTPELHPMLVAGPAVGEALEALLSDKGILFHPQHVVRRIDPTSNIILFDDTTVRFDLLVGVPPHRAPQPVIEAGLVDDTGYIPVHPQTLELLADPDTLEVHHPGVYALGDVAAVRLLNSMLLPKAGVFAEGQAAVVASSIAAQIRGEERPRGYDGHGFCYVEVGGELAAHGTGNFYAYPGPRVVLEEPSSAAWKAKREYEQVLDAWFHA